MPAAKITSTKNKPIKEKPHRKVVPRLNGKNDSKKNPKGAGRNPTPIDLHQVETLAARGLSQRQICLTLDISESTFIANKRRNAEIVAALERGKAKGVALIAGKLIEAAQNMQPWAIQMYLRTQAREQFGDVQRTELTGKDGKDLPTAPSSVVTESAVRAVMEKFDKDF